MPPGRPSGRSLAAARVHPTLRGVLTRTRAALADPAVLGLVGSILVAFGSLGVGVTPKPDPINHLPVFSLLRTTLLGQGLTTASIIAGVAMLVTAWLAIGRELRAGRGPSSRRLPRIMWLWSLPLLLTPPLFSRDPYSYVAQGHLVQYGFDAYLVGPFVTPGPFADSVDPIWITTPAPYGPLFLTLAAAVTKVTGESVYLGVLGMRLLALAGIAILLRYLPRLAVTCRVDPRAALWLGLVNPLTLMHFVSGAHNDALMIALIVAGLALAAEAVTARRAAGGLTILPGRARAVGKLVAAAAVIALAAAVKAPAALVLGFVGLLWARRFASATAYRRRALGWALAGGVGLVTFVALTAATGVGYGWVDALDTPGSIYTLLSPPTALGMVAGGAARLLGLGDPTIPLIDAVRSVSGVLCAVAIGWLLLRRRAEQAPVRDTALALLLVVLLGPVVQPWYLMWALVPLAAAGIRTAREGKAVLWVALGSMTISQINGSTFTGFFALPGTAACLAVTAWVIRRARAAERAEFGSAFDLANVRPREAAPAGSASAAPVLAGTAPSPAA